MNLKLIQLGEMYKCCFPLISDELGLLMQHFWVSFAYSKGILDSLSKMRE